jgi:hypothetical protein
LADQVASTADPEPYHHDSENIRELGFSWEIDTFGCQIDEAVTNWLKEEDKHGTVEDEGEEREPLADVRYGLAGTIPATGYRKDVVRSVFPIKTQLTSVWLREKFWELHDRSRSRGTNYFGRDLPQEVFIKVPVPVASPNAKDKVTDTSDKKKVDTAGADLYSAPGPAHDSGMDPDAQLLTLAAPLKEADEEMTDVPDEKEENDSDDDLYSAP